MRVPFPRTTKTILGRSVIVHPVGMGSDGVVEATFDLYTAKGKARINCHYEWQAFNEAKRLIETGRL